MAIQQRRGADADFNADKMLPGELAVTTDGTRKVYATFAPGDVKELASAEEVQEIVDEFNESVTKDIEKAKEEIEHKKEEVLKEIPDYKKQITELETYKANSILSKASGEVVTTTDSAKVRPKNIKLFGKSAQKRYEGNQLLDVNDVKTNLYGTIDDEGYVTFEYDNTQGTTSIYPRLIINTSDLLQPHTSYALVTEIVEVSNVFMLAPLSSQDTCQFNETIQMGSSNIKTGKRVDIVTTLDDFGECECAIRCGVTIVAGASGKIKFRLSIIEDTTVTADTFIYEPFVGGEASPSLEYKQKVTPIGESGSIVQRLLTTQFYDVSKITNNAVSIDSEGWITASIDNSDGTGIKYSSVNVPPSDLINQGEQYLVVCEIESNTLDYFEIVSTNESVNRGQFVNGFGLASGSKGVFVSKITARDDFTGCTTMLRTTLRANTGISGSIKFRISIIKDTTVTADTFIYEPYTEQPLTLQTPNGLHGIPLGQTIPDAIKNSPIHMSGVYWDSVEQQYYIGDTKNEDGKDVQRIAKLDILVYNDMSIYTGALSTVANFRLENKNYKNLGIDLPIICNALIPSYTWAQDKECCWCMHVNGIDFSINYERLGITSDATSKERIAVLKTWLDNNEIEFYYILAEPIVTDTSDEDQAQYNAVHMNYPNTTIVNDAGAYMEVEYVADTKEHIKQNYTPNSVTQDLEQRLSNVESQIALNS